MIQKSLIKLKCKQDGVINGHAGKELHAQLFNCLGEINPELAKKIHNEKIKSFTVGPLVGNILRKEGLSRITAGEEYFFSISTLNEELSGTLSTILNKLSISDLLIGNNGFVVKSTQLHYEEPLPYFKLNYNGEPKNKFVLDFLSPTCFRKDGRLQLLPLPSLVFGGLLERWNAFSETKLPATLFDVIYITRYNLKTNTVDFGNYKLVGCRGICEYTFLPEAREIDKWVINTLVNYAAISGIGYKTTMGMGQVKPEK